MVGWERAASTSSKTATPKVKSGLKPGIETVVTNSVLGLPPLNVVSKNTNCTLKVQKVKQKNKDTPRTISGAGRANQGK